LPLAPYFHTATLLANGQVLVTGGYDSNNSATVRLTFKYDDSSGTNGIWSPTNATMEIDKYSTMTLLPDGKVLVTGGATNTISPDDLAAVSDVQLYDPATGTWTATNSMNFPRASHTATLLPNGKVLVAGGFMSVTNGSAYGGAAATSSELFDPSTGTWTISGNLNYGRSGHTATLLPNGKVLAAGSAASLSAELFDPDAGTWALTGSMKASHSGHTATLLPNGKVLVAGGYSSTSESYDPAAGTWSTNTPMSLWRMAHTATLLPSGKVLVVGGYTSSALALATAETFDFTTGIWTTNTPMNIQRQSHLAMLLPNGKVLVAGGRGGQSLIFPHALTNLVSVELYDPASGTWTTNTSKQFGGYGGDAVLLPDGRVLTTAGTNNGVAEIFDPGLGYPASAQPQISPAPTLTLGSSLAIAGAQFRGVSESSGGNSRNSASDCPVVQLRSVASGQTTFLLASNWTSNSYTSTPVIGFPPGYTLATMFVNGIPSTSRFLNVSATTPSLCGSVGLTNYFAKTTLLFKLDFTYYPGAVFDVLVSTNPSLPLASWSTLGSATHIAPGHYQFIDLYAWLVPQRFYQVRLR